MARADTSKPNGSGRGTVKALSAAGVVAAGAIAVSANILAARFYERWDWTSSGLYTLSQATRDTLAELEEPVDVIVLLSASDPLTLSVRHMLDAYGAESKSLRVRYVDPDRNPAEFLALQQKYKLLTGKTEDGRVVTDASIIIARGDRHWFVTTDDMVVVDENDGRARPQLEQALTEGLRNVLLREKAKICFSTGHQEISIDDGGPAGLAELRYRLEKNNYEVEAVDFSGAKLPPLETCRVLVVPGPEVKVESKAAEHMRTYFEGGGNVLLLANPVLDENNRIEETGLEPVARAGGVEFNGDFVIERDESARLPTGLGETYLAVPVTHDITRGMIRDEKADFKVLLSASQSLKKGTAGAPTELLRTSNEAFSVKDIRPFTEGGKTVSKGPDDPGGPFSVAMASELPKAKDSSQKHGPRLVVVGTANVAWGRNWREPTLLGNRMFMENALSWLSARPAIVSVPDKATVPIGLSLTEESLGEVLRYVLVYMPGAVALLGGFIMYRRRAEEKRSRRQATPPEPRTPEPAPEPEEAPKSEREA